VVSAGRRKTNIKLQGYEKPQGYEIFFTARRRIANSNAAATIMPAGLSPTRA
jgi:hypothetical protein